MRGFGEGFRAGPCRACGVLPPRLVLSFTALAAVSETSPILILRWYTPRLTSVSAGRSLNRAFVIHRHHDGAGLCLDGGACRVEASIIEVHGRDKLDSARSQGQGVIVLAPHFGNWEVLNFWLSSHFPFTAMYEPPKITNLEPIIRHGRERMGAQSVPTNPRGVAALLKALKRSEAIGILPDQEPDWGSGVFAPFYARDAYTATLLPKLVARTQARVVTGVALRLPGRGFAIHFLDADERVYSADETVSASGVNASVEASIALEPAQYQWEYKRYRKVIEEQQQNPNANDFRLY